MPEQFHRPVRRPTAAFDNIIAGTDTAEQSRVAHATASALLERARSDESGDSAERMVAFAAEHGIDDIAELWANSPARSLPGTLWRLYLLQISIRDDAAMTALLYERGRVELQTADAVIAGAPAPASPQELTELVDTILRGVFRGDFAIALFPTLDAPLTATCTYYIESRFAQDTSACAGPALVLTRIRTLTLDPDVIFRDGFES